MIYLSICFYLELSAEKYVVRVKCLLKQALKYFAKDKKYLDKLVETTLISVAKYGGSDDGFSLSSAIVNFMLQKDGIHKARKAYKR